MATITQLAVGKPKTVEHNGQEILTGIFKTPVDGRIEADLLNLAGDGQADLTVHGGRDKAIYVYPEFHYAAWAGELGVAQLEPAQFGENLTVSDLSEATVTVGDTYRFGSITAIVAQPRLPCFKLGIRMHDDTFAQRFLESGRLGFYLRVEEAGNVGVGDSFELLERPDHGITVHSLWQTVFGGVSNASEAQRCLDLLPHLDAGWQRRLRNVIRSSAQ